MSSDFCDGNVLILSFSKHFQEYVYSKSNNLKKNLKNILPLQMIFTGVRIVEFESNQLELEGKSLNAEVSDNFLFISFYAEKIL